MKFTQEHKFEFTEDIGNRRITLITSDARTVFQFPADYDEVDFLRTYDFFLDFTVSALPRIMGEIASKIPHAYILSELKPGLVYDNRHQPEFFINRKGKQVNRDRWSDGLTWEEWCSEEQIAKEYYSNRKPRKPRDDDDDDKPDIVDDWVRPVKELRSYQQRDIPKRTEDKNLGDILDDLFG